MSYFSFKGSRKDGATYPRFRVILVRNSETIERREFNDWTSSARAEDYSTRRRRSSSAAFTRLKRKAISEGPREARN